MQNIKIGLAFYCSHIFLVIVMAQPMAYRWKGSERNREEYAQKYSDFPELKVHAGNLTSVNTIF